MAAQNGRSLIQHLDSNIWEKQQTGAVSVVSATAVAAPGNGVNTTVLLPVSYGHQFMALGLTRRNVTNANNQFLGAMLQGRFVCDPLPLTMIDSTGSQEYMFATGSAPTFFVAVYRNLIETNYDNLVFVNSDTTNPATVSVMVATGRARIIQSTNL
jgi:hypothetical protein